MATGPVNPANDALPAFGPEFADRLRIPFLHVRAVSDKADEALDARVLTFVDDVGRVRPIAVRRSLHFSGGAIVSERSGPVPLEPFRFGLARLRRAVRTLELSLDASNQVEKALMSRDGPISEAGRLKNGHTRPKKS